MNNKNRYVVFDYYDCFGDEGEPFIVGSGNTKQDIAIVIENWENETDGEMLIEILDRKTKKEIRFDDIE